MTGAALVLALALVAFSVLGEVTRKTKLPGLLVLTAGLLQIAAPQPGQIAEVLVREGELVQAGQALMRLRSERVTGGGRGLGPERAGAGPAPGKPRYGTPLDPAGGPSATRCAQ